LDRYAVTGSSGGGPHVLAAAAHGGDRMVRARCNVGLAPYDADGLDYYAGMDPMNVEEFGWALDGEQRLVPEVERLLDEMRERMAADATKFISDDWKLDEADRAVMADPRIVEQNRVIGAELVECGQWGWVDDDIAFVKPWGFDLGDIVAPVQVCYGLKDVLVPPGHGEWLARHIPQAEVVVNDASGHLTRPDEVGAIMHWLVSGKQPA
jgi:pimeloyl-ACP methyl ester carboxylesterase